MPQSPSDSAIPNGEPQGKLKFGQKLLNSLICASNDPNSPKKTCTKKLLDCVKPNDDEPAAEVDTGTERETWGNRCTFFISTLGMSVGLGQVWRFPTLAYSQGGGTFLIIYGLMIFLFGNSLFFFEIINGQYTSKNPLTVYDKVPLFQGIGWSMIMYSYLFCVYYSHMVSFAIYYLGAGFSYVLPWSVCPKITNDIHDSYNCVPFSKIRDPEIDNMVCGDTLISYNLTDLCKNEKSQEEQRKKCCSAMNVTGDICYKYFNVTDLCKKREYPSEYYWSHSVNRLFREDDPHYGTLGEVNYWLLICSFLSWFFAYATLYKGLKSLGCLMYIMVPLPYIVLIIMFGVVIPHDGAIFGLLTFFTPKLESFYDITVWRVATEQAFYSLGVAMGPLITFGSYSKFNNPSHVDGVLICLCIFLTSILCSLVVFSVLGFLSVKTGRPFDKVVEAGPGLVFIVYPESLELLPGSHFFSALFYLMLINLGLSSVTGIIETVTSAVYDIWPKTRKYKYLVSLGVIASCFLIGLPITFRGGLNVYNAFDTYGAGIPLIPICGLELFVIVYIYGLGRFCEDIAFMIGFYPNRYYRYQWMVGPFILLAVCIYGLCTLDYKDQPLWVILLGWFLFLLIMGTIPAGMFYKIYKYKKEGNLRDVIKPPPDHGPKNPSDRQERETFTTKRKIF